MQLRLSLPNELLHSITEYIAYKPRPPNSGTTGSLVRRASPELLALSVANWQLRRVCLPFLFANLRIRHVEDAQKLVDDLSLFSRLTKTLAINHITYVTIMGDRILSQLLPQLEKLWRIELRSCRDRPTLLRAILAQPTVTSVLVYQLPDKSMCNDDLSKLILDRQCSVEVFSPAFEKYLNRGMRLGCLDIDDANSVGSLDELMASKLKEVRIHLFWAIPASFSFLSALSSTRSTLQELWLLDDGNYGHRLDSHIPPFLSSFIGISQEQNLRQSFTVTSVGVRRATGQFSQEWIVIGLTVQTTYDSSGSLIRILALIASSFPKLEYLTFDCNGHGARYHVNELAKSFGHFSCLRTLFLDKVYKQLDFGDDSFLPPALRVNPMHATWEIRCSRAEAGLSWFASWVAKEGKSLDAIHISDKGDEIFNEEDSSPEWNIRAWFCVVNSNRDITGTWEGIYPN
ncbi:hypothetical protein FB446DRAFT_788899 [Lentinula raphanica]|nr:hypothetical protein FB446DRAFT_788899 [Lentinula raphanica]